MRDQSWMLGLGLFFFLIAPLGAFGLTALRPVVLSTERESLDYLVDDAACFRGNNVLLVGTAISASEAAVNRLKASNAAKNRLNALEEIVRGFPDKNPDADPEFMKSVKHSVGKPLEDCNYLPEEMVTIEKLLKVFEGGKELPKKEQYDYIAGKLDEMSELPEIQRLQLKFGAKVDINGTIIGLKNRHCRAYLQNMFLMGLTKDQLLRVIRGQKPARK